MLPEEIGFDSLMPNVGNNIVGDDGSVVKDCI
jgi:hypothetical protein